MNAPLPVSVIQALASLSLDDKYAIDHGRAFMSGVQALVRLPMLQQVRDAAQGLRTAGFISGYRGSPLGGYDQALWQARSHLEAHHITFQPGVNEELAATAVWGTQQLDLYPQHRRFDGVFGLWYGKGPGVDRSADVFKHANMAGTARHGGVIAVAGDDHVARSSSVAHQSDHIFKACGLPVFFPASVQEILDLGLHAYALSRFSGLWAGMKVIQEIVESSTSISVDPDRVDIVIPTDFQMPPGGLHIRWPDPPLEQEARLMDHKWYAALAYVRANRLNRTVIDSPRARLGLIASGKAYNDTRQALHDLGLDDALCARMGIRLHKVSVVWPLEASTTRDFAMGLQEILVIEEKRQVIEYQLKEELYNWREDVRPHVLGKFNDGEGDHSGGEWSRPNPADRWLLRAKADLSPALIAKAIVQRLARLGMLHELDGDVRARIQARVAEIEAKERELAQQGASVERQPWFCSGCPHNTSTVVPEGSRALAGIGCHYMAAWMDRQTSTFSQMGGEGVAWVGQAPFTTEGHVFANLGDGTYFHSGLLAIRQSIAAKVAITYKILFNDAVAMTGGQPVDGTLRVPEMTCELRAEGVRQIVVVTDEPGKYDGVEGLAEGVTVHHRDDLDAVQKHMRTVPGCSVIIYDQTCATEKRRRRKRGKLPQMAQRVVINEAVCEGCGDCAVQSNCLSVETVDTELGRKRRINQSSCNQDLSCLRGFCPSLVTVEGGTLRHHAPALDEAAAAASWPALPEPRVPSASEAWGMVVAGVGGTGVITIGQLLGVAAHMEGKAVVTQDAAGLAQKGGATWSHVQMADTPDALFTTRVAMGMADVVLGCDAIVAAHAQTLAVMSPERTRVAFNTHQTPTAALVHEPGWTFPDARCQSALQAAARPGQWAQVDANVLAERLLGDAIFANPLMLGLAWQRGWVPLRRDALRRAIELNGVQVQANLSAFEWGRRAAVDPDAVQRLVTPSVPVQLVRPRKGLSGAALDAFVSRRQADLVAYQGHALAAHYMHWVQRIRSAEALVRSPHGGVPVAGEPLTEAVARQLYRLMAVKDEYEVARLMTQPAFAATVAEQFEGDWQVSWHFSLPWGRSAEPGQPRKVRFTSAWRPALKVLSGLRGLRGTWLDPLGWTAERRAERAWLRRYLAGLEAVATGLRMHNLDQALALALVPQTILGFGPIKQAAMAAAITQWDQALKSFFQPS